MQWAAVLCLDASMRAIVGWLDQIPNVQGPCQLTAAGARHRLLKEKRILLREATIDDAVPEDDIFLTSAIELWLGSA